MQLLAFLANLQENNRRLCTTFSKNYRVVHSDYTSSMSEFLYNFASVSVLLKKKETVTLI